MVDLLQIRRRGGLPDRLRADDRLHRTPLVVHASVDLDPQELPRLRTGETVLFLAERSTTEDVQSRIVDLPARIGAMREMSVAGGVPQAGRPAVSSGPGAGAGPGVLRWRSSSRWPSPCFRVRPGPLR